MFTRQRVVSWLTLAVLLLSLLLSGTIGDADAQGTVVASGLTNPVGVVVTDDGTLYVAEGGSGGAEPLPPPPGGEGEGPPGTRGLTGQVTRVAPGGAKTTLAGNLPSLAGAGPTSLVAAGGALWLTIGGAGFGRAGLPNYRPLPNEASIVRINPQTGAVASVADLGAFEVANNPDGFIVDTNPWGLALGADGNLYATDAGGNDLLRVNPATGQIGVVAVLPGQPFQQPNPTRGGRNEVDPVPTGVATGADGSIYVGLLPGGPPIPGGSKVVRVAPNGAISDAVRGLTYVVFLAMGPDGLLYVTELVSGLDTSGPEPLPLPGRVQRVLADGTMQVVADDLPFPGGIAFDRAGNLYVAINITTAGPPSPTPQGQVLRFNAVAAPMPGLPNTGAGGGSRTPATPLVVLGLVAIAGAGLLLAGRRYARNGGFGG